jgi:hypothetical protein
MAILPSFSVGAVVSVAKTDAAFVWGYAYMEVLTVPTNGISYSFLQELG